MEVNHIRALTLIGENFAADEEARKAINRPAQGEHCGKAYSLAAWATI